MKSYCMVPPSNCFPPSDSSKESSKESSSSFSSSSSSNNNKFNPTLSFTKPSIIDNHVYCLSTSKTLLKSKLVKSSVNPLVNLHNITYLVRVCNECPDYNIFNISVIDELTLSKIVLNNTSSNILIDISLTAANDIAINNFNITSSLSCAIRPTTQVLVCQLFGCPSNLPSYDTNNCRCTPQSYCAEFTLSYLFNLTANSNSNCPSYDINASNCVFADGIICSNYSNNPACKSCSQQQPNPKPVPEWFKHHSTSTATHASFSFQTSSFVDNNDDDGGGNSKGDAHNLNEIGRKILNRNKNHYYHNNNDDDDNDHGKTKINRFSNKINHIFGSLFNGIIDQSKKLNDKDSNSDNNNNHNDINVDRISSESSESSFSYPYFSESSGFSSSSSLVSISDLFPVCAKGCSVDTKIAFNSSLQNIDLRSELVCSLIDDQCQNQGCSAPTCTNAVFRCIWKLRNTGQTVATPFQFQVQLPFQPLVMPEFCQQTSTTTPITVLCSVDLKESKDNSDCIVIDGVVCFEPSTTSCESKTLVANMTNIGFNGCVGQINLNRVSSTIIVVPENDYEVIKKTAIDGNIATLPVLEYIDCSDSTKSNVIVDYLITITAPKCATISIESFTDISQYPIDTSYGVVVSNSTLISCTINVGNTIICRGVGPIGPGKVVTVRYKSIVSCLMCNTFDSLSCLKNVANNNITNISITTISNSRCDLNVPTSIVVNTPIYCSCPQCDCSADLPLFNITYFAQDVLLRHDSRQRFTSTYITCLVNTYNNSLPVNSYTGIYSSPVYGWFIHGGNGLWISNPFENSQTTNFAHMPLVSGYQYKISCCAYQNTFNYSTSPSNAPLNNNDFIQFIAFDSYSAPKVVSGNFTCRNTAVSTSYPAAIPLFRKVVG